MADPTLPPGYRLDRSDPDFLVLRRPDRPEVARFSASGAHSRHIELAAWRDYSRVRRGLLRDTVLADLRREIAEREDKFGDPNFLYAVDRLLKEIADEWKGRAAND